MITAAVARSDLVLASSDPASAAASACDDTEVPLSPPAPVLANEAPPPAINVPQGLHIECSNPHDAEALKGEVSAAPVAGTLVILLNSLMLLFVVSPLSSICV
jgi:hypothetical protein